MDWSKFLDLVKAKKAFTSPDADDMRYPHEHLAMTLGFLIGRASMGDAAAKAALLGWIGDPHSVNLCPGSTDRDYRMGPVRIGPMESFAFDSGDKGIDVAIAGFDGFLNLQYVWELNTTK